MRVTRREVLALTASAAVAGWTKASAADLTTDKIPTRIPLQEFVKDAALMDAFRRGVRAMKARPPSDPLSWFFQAAMHGVTLELIQVQAQKDPNIINVDQKKWWNQCPHFGQASANFLPWHRAYTHYFERILRAHTQEPRFSLPYWDYSDKNYRLFPEEWGRAKLKAPLDGDDSNPLFHPERNLYFTSWDHWSGEDGPYSEFSELAVDWSEARDAPVFFGSKDDMADERQGLAGNVADEDAYTRGRLESFPHDPIHRLVGGVVVMPPQPDPMHPGTPIQAKAARAAWQRHRRRASTPFSVSIIRISIACGRSGPAWTAKNGAGSRRNPGSTIPRGTSSTWPLKTGS
ncbi:MAG: tyrosinase family protein [Mesorhizobium sp.]|nr:tyrosinase family protein [Mesorhizobium sp.]TIR17100.1 MAG: tyrosinase family protein [Mesorhizobium sp.]